MSGQRSETRHARRLAAGGVAATIALYALAAGTRSGREFDAAVVALEWHGPAGAAATTVGLIVNPVTVIGAIAALTFVAAREHRRSAIAAPALIVGGSWLAAHALETGLGALDPRAWESMRALGPAFYPSGHAAVIMALCLTVLTGGSRLARAPVLAGGATLLACPHFLVAWHHPSDVVAGFLVAAAWSATVLRWLPAGDLPVRARRASSRRAVAIAAAAPAVAVIWLTPRTGVTDSAASVDVLLAVAAVGITAASVMDLFAGAVAARALPLVS